MKLSFDIIKEITLGTLRINEENVFITFKRFTGEEKELYKVTKKAFIKNIPVISGLDSVPENQNCYADLFLHPDDEVFGYYKKHHKQN